MKLKNAIPKIIIDGAIFNSLSTETLTEIGLTPYQLGLMWFKRSGNKSVNSLVEYFTKDEEITEEGTKILGQLFADKYTEPIHRLALAMNAEYNPIENYDRNESSTDTSKSNASSSSSGSNSSNGTTTNNVSAFDSSGYQPESQVTSSDSGNNSASGNSESSGTVAHESRTHGNVGVTTNQQMINEEIRLRTSEQIADMIMRWSDKEFLLKVYE